MNPAHLVGTDCLGDSDFEVGQIAVDSKTRLWRIHSLLQQGKPTKSDLLIFQQRVELAGNIRLIVDRITHQQAQLADLRSIQSYIWVEGGTVWKSSDWGTAD